MGNVKSKNARLFLTDLGYGMAWNASNPGSRMLAYNIPQKHARIAAIVASQIFLMKRIGANPLGFPNPTLRLAQYMMGQISLMELLLCWAGCILGATIGVKALYQILKILKVTSPASIDLLKPPEPKKDLRPEQVAAIETVVAFSYVVFLCGIIQKKGYPKIGIFGLLAIGILGKKWTGPGMDPAAVISKSITFANYKHLPYYLAGALLGGASGGLTVKAL